MHLVFSNSLPFSVQSMSINHISERHLLVINCRKWLFHKNELEQRGVLDFPTLWYYNSQITLLTAYRSMCFPYACPGSDSVFHNPVYHALLCRLITQWEKAALQRKEPWLEGDQGRWWGADCSRVVWVSHSSSCPFYVREKCPLAHWRKNRARTW